MNRIIGLIKAMPALMLVYISMLYNLYNVEHKDTKLYIFVLMATCLLLVISVILSIFHRQLYFKNDVSKTFKTLSINNRYYFLDRFNTWILIITPIVIFNDSTILSVILAFSVSCIVLIIISNENVHIHNLVFLVFYNMYESEYEGEEIVIVTRLKRNQITMGCNFDGYKMMDGHPIYLIKKTDT